MDTKKTPTVKEMSCEIRYTDRKSAPELLGFCQETEESTKNLTGDIDLEQ